MHRSEHAAVDVSGSFTPKLFDMEGGLANTISAGYIPLASLSVLSPVFVQPSLVIITVNSTFPVVKS